VDALDTLRNTGIHASVSPKCGTKLDYEFDVGTKYLLKQLTGS
jgi:hypothetical protein